MEWNEKTFKKFQSELKKMFVGKRDMLKTRPVLGAIHFTKDGDVEMTNSHVALRMTKCHTEGERLDPEFPEGTYYPNLERIFESVQHGNWEAEINTKELADILYPFQKQKLDFVVMTFSHEGINILPEQREGLEIISAELNTKLDVSEPFNVGVNPVYFYNAMNFFKTQKIKTVKMIASSPIRPMLFEHENLQYLITPVRIG